MNKLNLKLYSKSLIFTIFPSMYFINVTTFAFAQYIIICTFSIYFFKLKNYIEKGLPRKQAYKIIISLIITTAILSTLFKLNIILTSNYIIVSLLIYSLSSFITLYSYLFAIFLLNNRQKVSSYLYLLFPIMLGGFVTKYQPNYDLFYFIALIPLMSLIPAIGYTQFKKLNFK